jgi:hypothetical protein
VENLMEIWKWHHCHASAGTWETVRTSGSIFSGKAMCFLS